MSVYESLWYWVRYEDDMHVHHLQHLFPCNVYIYIYMSCHMCVHLIINPVCINQTYSKDSLNKQPLPTAYSKLSKCTFIQQ